MSRALNWCFTLNNPDDDQYVDPESGYPDMGKAIAAGASAIVMQREIGQNGTKHVQGYIRFSERKRLSQLRDIVDPFAHYEVAKGTPKQNLDYCTKEESRDANFDPFVFGVFPDVSQGKRNDIAYIRDRIIKDNVSFSDLVSDDSTVKAVARSMRFVETCYQFQQPPSRPNVHVTFHFGAAGCGKTHCAIRGDGSNECYVTSETGRFMERYISQRKVVFDEMDGHRFTPTEFNQMLDKNPYVVPVKGSSRPFLAEDIHVTSNYDPNTWWGEKTKYTQAALDRRVHEVHEHYIRIDENGNPQYAFHRFVTDPDAHYSLNPEKFAMYKYRSWKAACNLTV